MRIIVADSDERFREIIRYVLAYHFAEADVVALDPVATSLLTMLPAAPAEASAVCLVVDARTAVSGWKEELAAARDRLGDRLHLIVCCEPRSRRPELRAEGFVEKPGVIDPIVSLVRAIPGGAARNRRAGLDRAYVRVAQQLLEAVEASPVDLYLQASPGKYVRVLGAGEPLGHSPLSALKKNAGGDLWVAASDASRLLGAFEAWLAGLRAPAREFEPGSDIPLSIEAQRMLHGLFQALGFTSDVQRVARLAVQTVVAQLKSEPRVCELLAALEREHESYLCAHSMMMAYLACAASQALAWDSEFTLRKLATAAILHDLPISSDELARLRTLQDLGRLRSEGRNEDAVAVESHPQLAAQLARSMTDFPLGADVIIEQHHVQPDGLGLTSDIKLSKIDPLSALFIILHDLLDRVFAGGAGRDVGKLLKAMAADYKTPPFAKPFAALRSLRTGG